MAIVFCFAAFLCLGNLCGPPKRCLYRNADPAVWDSAVAQAVANMEAEGAPWVLHDPAQMEEVMERAASIRGCNPR
jgi:hypothetical protein